MDDLKEDILDENMVAIASINATSTIKFEKFTYESLINRSMNIYYFLIESNRKLSKIRRFEREDVEKLTECLDYLQSFFIYYNKQFVLLLGKLLRKLYTTVSFFQNKNQIYSVMKKIENTLPCYVPVDKNRILSVLFMSVRNSKVLFHFLKSKIMGSQVFSVSEKKHILVLFRKIIKFALQSKILTKKTFSKFLKILSDDRLIPTLIRRKKKSRGGNFLSRFFKNKVINKTYVLTTLENKENYNFLNDPISYPQTNFKQEYSKLNERQAKHNNFEEDSLYYKVKFEKYSKKLNSNKQYNYKKIKKEEVNKSNSYSPNINEHSIYSKESQKNSSSSSSISNQNFNKYDNSQKNAGVLFQLCIPVKNYIATGLNFDKCDETYQNYISLKFLEIQNPDIIRQNLSDFENKILIPLYQKIMLNSQKKKPLFNYTFAKYRNILTNFISKETHIPFSIEPYGSYSNNFLLEEGDIDICIIPEGDDYLRKFEPILEKVNDYLVSENYAVSEALIRNSRYLLLKFVDKETKFNIDLTVHTLLPLLNTKLIRLYSNFDQRFHILGIYLKYWSKLNKVQGTTNYFLSSYALILMLIYFLQNIADPKVLPNLQKIEEKEVNYDYKYMGKQTKVNIYFTEDLVKAKEFLLKQNNNKVNSESVTSLLIKFLEFFSYYFDNFRMKISISSKDIEETFKEVHDNYAFSMEDPFDPNHNPGKSMYINSLSYEAFIQAMRLEINNIIGGEYMKRLKSTQGH